ncbi:MAG: hypothetical protein WA950_15955 [Shinella sp.]|uniref:hypothetical protein n=1 Tax=Shinella sp. TaxID=1870904 RepID=UPI003C76118A
MKRRSFLAALFAAPVMPIAAAAARQEGREAIAIAIEQPRAASEISLNLDKAAMQKMVAGAVREAQRRRTIPSPMRSHNRKMRIDLAAGTLTIKA